MIEMCKFNTQTSLRYKFVSSVAAEVNPPTGLPGSADVRNFHSKQICAKASFNWSRNTEESALDANDPEIQSRNAFAESCESP